MQTFTAVIVHHRVIDGSSLPTHNNIIPLLYHRYHGCSATVYVDVSILLMTDRAYVAFKMGLSIISRHHVFFCRKTSNGALFDVPIFWKWVPFTPYEIIFNNKRKTYTLNQYKTRSVFD